MAEAVVAIKGGCLPWPIRSIGHCPPLFYEIAAGIVRTERRIDFRIDSPDHVSGGIVERVRRFVLGLAGRRRREIIRGRVRGALRVFRGRHNIAEYVASYRR